MEYLGSGAYEYMSEKVKPKSTFYRNPRGMILRDQLPYLNGCDLDVALHSLFHSQSFRVRFHVAAVGDSGNTRRTWRLF